MSNNIDKSSMSRYLLLYICLAFLLVLYDSYIAIPVLFAVVFINIAKDKIKAFSLIGLLYFLIFNGVFSLNYIHSHVFYFPLNWGIKDIF